MSVLRLDRQRSYRLSLGFSHRFANFLLEKFAVFGPSHQPLSCTLGSGTLFASFTPDLPYSACEVSNDGCGVVFGEKIIII